MRKNCIGVCVLLAACSWFGNAAAELYKVSATLSYKGEVFGAPTAVVKNGTPASVEVSGPSGYKFGFTVKDIAPDVIEVATDVESRHGRFAPTVAARPGQAARVSVGDLGLGLVVERTSSGR